MYPKVSIQIPTYNQQGFIQRTIESCLMQDYANLEINIADDNSTDDTGKLVQAYMINDKVRYFKNTINIGRVANYRKALYEYATGEWVINLDGDDYFTDSGFVSKAMADIAKMANKHVLVYQANHNITKIATLLPGSKWINENTILVNGKEYYLKYPEILNFTHCATMYNRKAAMELNFYSFNCLFTDFNSLVKLFIRGNILLSSKTVAVWHQHDLNQSSTLDHTKLKVELASFDEIAVFAEKYLPVKEVQLWNKRMKTFMLSIYQGMQQTTKGKIAGVKYLFLHFSFEKMHLRQLAKALLNVAVNKSTKNK